MNQMKLRREKKRNRIKKDEERGKFELRFYAGYKGEEIPKSVVIGTTEFIIKEIISRERILDQKSGKMVEVFKCRMEGEIVKIKVYESGEWEISFPDKS